MEKKPFRGEFVPRKPRVNEVSTMRQYYAIGVSPMNVEGSASRARPEALEQDRDIRELERGFQAKLERHMAAQTESLRAELSQERIRFDRGEKGRLASSAVFQHAVQNSFVDREHGPQAISLLQVYSPMGYHRVYGVEPARVKEIVGRHMDELHEKVAPLVAAHNASLKTVLGL